MNRVPKNDKGNHNTIILDPRKQKKKNVSSSIMNLRNRPNCDADILKKRPAKYVVGIISPLLAHIKTYLY